MYIQTLQDAFNAKMSMILTFRKKGGFKVASGYYSEKAMKDELKFDKNLVMQLDLAESGCPICNVRM